MVTPDVPPHSRVSDAFFFTLALALFVRAPVVGDKLIMKSHKDCGTRAELTTAWFFNCSGCGDAQYGQSPVVWSVGSLSPLFYTRGDQDATRD